MNDTALTLLTFDDNLSTLLQLVGNGRRKMLTCALDNCSIVVNTYGHRFVITTTLPGCTTCNDVGIFLSRVRACSNNRHLTTIIQQRIHMLQNFLLLGSRRLSIVLRGLFTWLGLLLLASRGLDLISLILEQGIIIGVGNGYL